jgi:hypothetical protein
MVLDEDACQGSFLSSDLYQPDGTARNTGAQTSPHAFSRYGIPGALTGTGQKNSCLKI